MSETQLDKLIEENEERSISNIDKPTSESNNFFNKRNVRTLKRSSSSSSSNTKAKKIKHKILKKRVFFILGSILGALLAFLYVFHYNYEIPMFTDLADYLSFKLEDLEMLSFFQSQRQNIFKNISASLFPEKSFSLKDLSPGLQLMQNYTLKPKHSIVIIPGIITSGLESWSLNGCSQKYFRKRLWGTLTMFKAAFMDKECWIKNIKLDENGQDPEGAKLRAAQGLDAGDYFVFGYWVWGKIIENFAAIGYDNNNMHLAAYDWRLAYKDLETRDKYFSKLKKTIENSYEYDNKNKVIVLTHSMGGLVFYYFLKWAESEKGGKGGKKWAEKYIYAIVNVGGSFLGATKTISTLISGEQKELVQPLTAFVLNRFLTKKERVDIIKSWLGMASLIPKGGSTIWGQVNRSSEQTLDNNSNITLSQHSNGAIVRLSNGTHITQYDMDQAIDLVFKILGKDFEDRIRSLYSFGIAKSEKEIREDDERTWSNPLESQLPYAPSMKIYCLYGYGNPTEYAYYYTKNPDYKETDSKTNEEVMYYIDPKKEDLNLNISDGVLNAEGDGSVQILSLGFMGVKGWKNKLYNPANIRIITREYKHNPVPLYEDMRGGIGTADHVDILGNHELTVIIKFIEEGHLEDCNRSSVRFPR